MDGTANAVRHLKANNLKEMQKIYACAGKEAVMLDRHNLIPLLALQKILFNHQKIAYNILSIAGCSSALFEGARERFRPCFGNEALLWEKFRTFDDFDPIEEELKEYARQGIKCLSIEDHGYPGLLKEIYDPPLILYMKRAGGALPEGPAVAIVGSRKASQNGLRVAAEIAEGLSLKGVVIVSGMAYGIDSAAHYGALAGGGETIAVLGCGPDIVYPPENENLSKKIFQSGAIISEFFPGTKPHRANFPRRNRILSGLCIATIIVEAAEKSGSLITARLALGEGRDVMSVPGPAGHIGCRGTNRLIREGAGFVECAEDVINLISSHLPKDTKPENTGLFETDVDKDSKILSVLKKSSAISNDEVIFLTGLSAGQVLNELTQLVVAGKVEECPGQKFRLKNGSINA